MGFEWFEFNNTTIFKSSIYNDPSLPLVRQGGITTSLILPGSSNVMSGIAYVFKMKEGMPQDMLFPNTTKFLKFAIGQNPIRNGQRLNRTPHLEWELHGKFKIFKFFFLLQIFY